MTVALKKAILMKMYDDLLCLIHICIACISEFVNLKLFLYRLKLHHQKNPLLPLLQQRFVFIVSFVYVLCCLVALH